MLSSGSKGQLRRTCTESKIQYFKSLELQSPILIWKNTHLLRTSFGLLQLWYLALGFRTPWVWRYPKAYLKDQTSIAIWKTRETSLFPNNSRWFFVALPIQFVPLQVHSRGDDLFICGFFWVCGRCRSGIWQKVQSLSPRISGTYLIRLFWGWVFPYINLTYSL